MNQSKPDMRPLAPLTLPIYLVAFMMVALSLAQAAASLGSFQPGVLKWRFGAVGLISGSVPTLAFGTLLAVVAAALLQHRWALRVLSVLAGLVSLAFLCLVVLFALDALQLKREVRPEALHAYYLASGRAIFSLALGFITTGAICVSGFRISRSKDKQRAEIASPTDASVLIARASTNR